MICDNCHRDVPRSKGMAASNDKQSIWLCADCVMKQSNGYEVMDDLD